MLLTSEVRWLAWEVGWRVGRLACRHEAVVRLIAEAQSRCETPLCT